jgi:hypothetical protein
LQGVVLGRRGRARLREGKGKEVRRRGRAGITPSCFYKICFVPQEIPALSSGTPTMKAP